MNKNGAEVDFVKKNQSVHRYWLLFQNQCKKTMTTDQKQLKMLKVTLTVTISRQWSTTVVTLFNHIFFPTAVLLQMQQECHIISEKCQTL